MRELKDVRSVMRRFIPMLQDLRSHRHQDNQGNVKVSLLIVSVCAFALLTLPGVPLEAIPVCTMGCPVEIPTVCTDDTMECPDGSLVWRNPDDNCNFFSCPEVSNSEELCHYRKGRMDWKHKVVGSGALIDHLTNHPNDGQPGTPVPGVDGFVFTDDCGIEEVQVACTGGLSGPCGCICSGSSVEFFTDSFTQDTCLTQCEGFCEANAQEVQSCEVLRIIKRFP